MSSQGPSSGTLSGSAGSIGCYGPSTRSQVPVGYPTTNRTFRDSSDWIRYKKELRTFYATRVATSTDPWFVAGNDYRLSWLNGRFKCTSCSSGAFTDPSTVANK